MNNIIRDNAKSPEQNRRLEGDKPSKDIFDSPQKRQKPQISSIPGVSPKELNRYRVMVGDEEIATGLTSDEAIALAGEAVRWAKQDLRKIVNLGS